LAAVDLSNLEKGIAKGEFSPTVEADGVATIIISTLEGSLKMSKFTEIQFIWKGLLNI
jgi:hypothetical protein